MFSENGAALFFLIIALSIPAAILFAMKISTRRLTDFFVVKHRGNRHLICQSISHSGRKKLKLLRKNRKALDYATFFNRALTLVLERLDTNVTYIAETHLLGEFSRRKRRGLISWSDSDVRHLNSRTLFIEIWQFQGLKTALQKRHQKVPFYRIEFKKLSK